MKQPQRADLPASYEPTPCPICLGSTARFKSHKRGGLYVRCGRCSYEGMYDLGVGSQLFLGWRGLLSDPAVSAALRHELANVQLRPLPAEELQEVCLCCLNTETGRYKPQKRGHMGSCFTCGWRRGFFNSPLATESAIRWLVRLGDLVFHQRILELMAAHLPTDP